MRNIIVVASDTDAGKTTLSGMWLNVAYEMLEYWKPLESGPPDSERVRTVAGTAVVHPSLMQFEEAVAPMLAAKRLGETIPTADHIASHAPTSRNGRRLLIETFGSPLSPLNNTELQLELIRLLNCHIVVVGCSSVGAVGRVLQTLAALEECAAEVSAVVLMGGRDKFAEQQIQYHGKTCVVSISRPESFDSTGIQQSAEENRTGLEGLLRYVIESENQELASDKSLQTTDSRYVWHPYTSLGDPDPPLPARSAHAEFINLVDGRRVIDAISSWWTIQHGHCHPVLMNSLRNASRVMDHVLFAGVTHEWGIELAKIMVDSMNWADGGRMFYSDNGSTAVEVALKMAYQFWHQAGEPDRRLFIGFEGGYHGDTFGAMSVGRDPVFFGRFEPFLFDARMIPISAEELDRELNQCGSRVAAVIIEPLVQGAAGMIMHSKEELHAIAEVTKRHGVLLIIDEVMTGGGRTGHLWAHQSANVVPDFVCTGKTIAGGGLPIAGTLVAPRIVEAWENSDRTKTFYHGHSFTAHPLACAVGVTNWRELVPGIEKKAQGIESFWQQAQSRLSELPHVSDVRIQGTIIALNVQSQDSGYLANVGRQLRLASLEKDVYLRPLGDVLYAIPPLETRESSLEQIVESMVHAVESVL